MPWSPLKSTQNIVTLYIILLLHKKLASIISTQRQKGEDKVVAILFSSTGTEKSIKLYEAQVGNFLHINSVRTSDRNQMTSRQKLRRRRTFGALLASGLNPIPGSASIPVN